MNRHFDLPKKTKRRRLLILLLLLSAALFAYSKLKDVDFSQLIEKYPWHFGIGTLMVVFLVFAMFLPAGKGRSSFWRTITSDRRDRKYVARTTQKMCEARWKNAMRDCHPDYDEDDDSWII